METSLPCTCFLLHSSPQIDSLTFLCFRETENGVTEERAQCAALWEVCYDACLQGNSPQKGAHIWEWRGSPFTLFPPHHLAGQRTRLRKEKQAAGRADKGLEGEWQVGRLRRQDPPAAHPAEQLPICVLARQPLGRPITALIPGGQCRSVQLGGRGRSLPLLCSPHPIPTAQAPSNVTIQWGFL